jgi:type I restriction enzyme S subunit
LAIEQLKKRVHGSTMKHFKRSELKTTYIPLPPLPEQRKIAEILSTVDKAIQKVDEAIAKTERLKKGLMQELLTKGIGHEKFKDTEIGRIPVEWEVVKLGDLINIMSGQYFSYKEFSDGGVKCLKIDNVGFGEILWDTITFLPEIYLKKYPELVLQAGDVVMALNRPIINGNLKIGLLKKSDVPSLLYQRVGKVIFKENKLNKHFFFFFSMSHYFMNQINKLLVGTDQPYIRTPILLKMKIPLPPLKEQQKIAEILSTVDKSLELERKRKEKLERIKKGLMNDLLTGRIRVRQGGFK